MIILATRLNDVERVRLVLQQMKDDKLEILPGNLTWSFLVGFYTKNEDKAGIKQSYQDLQQNPQFLHNTENYSAIIRALDKIGQPSDVIKAFDRMCQLGIPANNSINFSVDRSYLKLNNNNEAFQAPTLQTRELTELSSHNEWHNTISSLLKKGNLKQALELYDNMKTNGTKPAQPTITTLLKSFCREGDLITANTLFVDMSSFGYLPLVRDYVYLLDGCLQAKQFSLSVDVAKKALNQGIRITSSFVSKFYEAFVPAIAQDIKAHILLQQDLASFVNKLPRDKTGLSADESKQFTELVERASTVLLNSKVY